MRDVSIDEVFTWREEFGHLHPYWAERAEKRMSRSCRIICCKPT
jgi:hypothetical protein